MALPNHCQGKRQRSFRGLRPHLHVTFIFAAMILIGVRPVLGSLGESESQYNERYGNGKVQKFDAPTKTKEVVYHSSSYANVWVHFTDCVADIVQYFGDPKSMTDAYVESCLGVNAQGHQWHLMKLEGDFSRHWQRDDGAIAEEKPYTTEDGEHLVSLYVWPPPLRPTATQVPPEEPSFIHQLAKGLGICVMVGVGIGAFCWFVPTAMLKLADYLPNAQKHK